MKPTRSTSSLLSPAWLRNAVVVLPVLLFHRVVRIPEAIVEVIEKMAFHK